MGNAHGASLVTDEAGAGAAATLTVAGLSQRLGLAAKNQLTTQTKLRDQIAIAIDVLVFEVVE